jgi:hypothetical protein
MQGMISKERKSGCFGGSRDEELLVNLTVFLEVGSKIEENPPFFPAGRA